MGKTSAWFYFSGNDSSPESGIREGLSDCGIALDEIGSSANGHGIVCFSEVNDRLLQFLHEMRRRSGGLILALAVSRAAIGQGHAWRLLHAGASDALAWEGGGRAASQVRARLERWHVVDQLAEDTTQELRLIGNSQPWRGLVRRLVEAAHYSVAPILLVGESGTGKELLARLVHLAGRPSVKDGAASRDMVTIDCSTIVQELSGSELFGHERGAFTGAVGQREGAFAQAEGGTLFLDEIGELSPTLQAQLLRAVQEKTYKRVGGNVWQTADFRLVCATNRDLPDLVAHGHFRLDLYHRISGWIFRMPPLRDRAEDVLPLARDFLELARPDLESPEFDSAVREFLLRREYPGNVRELRQLIQRIAHRHVDAGPITAGDIPEDDRPCDGALPQNWPDDALEKAIGNAITLGMSLKEISQATVDTAIRIAVQSEQGSLQRAARKLGVTDRALQMRRASGKVRTAG